MGLDDRPADRQPDAHAVGLRREEGVEDAIGSGRIQPHAVSSTATSTPARSWFRDIVAPSAVRDCAHGFNAVHDQIQHDLLQLDPVSKDGRSPENSRCAAQPRAAAAHCA